MKITFILPRATLSGGLRVVAIYARHLIARGHEVTVISHQRTIPPVRRVLDAVRGRPGKKKTRSDLLDFLGDRHIVLDQDLPESDARVPQADVIVATWWHTAEWVGRLPAEKGRKFYLLQDYEMFDYTPADRVVATYRLPLRKLAVSGYIRDNLADHHGIRDVAVIANSVDLNQFDAPLRDKTNPLTVGFLYTPKPRKRSDLAVEAVIAARRKLPQIRVLAFGSKPPNEPGVLPDWIEFRVAPPQDAIPKIYAACDAWLFSSEAEGFGLPILEAMACRTPVIATPAGAAPDLIDGHNSVLVDGTVAAFVEQIVAFDAMDPAEWRRFSDAAWQTAHSYSWADATDILLGHFTADAPADPAG